MGRCIVERIELDGLEISIEVQAGSKRTGKDKHGTPWEQTVTAAYGYILGTSSPDGENLDCWVRKNPRRGGRIYVVHQLSVDGSSYDEDKVMLGYGSQSEAVKAFKANCFKPSKMYGGVSEFDLEHFKVIAYSARKSKVMLASQRLYDKFEEKGLIPRGIKSPIQLSQIVKESMTMALHVTYTSQLVAESAFELARANEINVLKSHNDLIFESEADLGKFIRILDESVEDRAHLGDLEQMLPEDFSMITESNLTDAIDDLKSELQTSSAPLDVASSIANDYGLDTNQLITAFEKAVGMRISNWAEHRDNLRASEKRSATERQANAAAAKALADQEKAARRSAAAQKAAATRGMSRAGAKRAAAEIAQDVMFGIGDVFPDGDWYDVLERVIRRNGYSWSDWQDLIEPYFPKAFKDLTGFKDPHAYMADMYDQYQADGGYPGMEAGQPNPYRESIDDLLKLSGVKSQITETRGTPTVHAVKDQIVSLNEAHNNAVRKFLVNAAVKKQNTIMESATGVDLDAALRRFANTLLKYPNASTEHVFARVAEATVENANVLREHVEATTGLSLEGFRAAISQRRWDGNVISRPVFESLMESTETLWNIDTPDKGVAFTKACK